MPRASHYTTAFKTGACKHPQSEAFASKYLHPPSDLSPAYSGYPDNNNSPSVHSEFRITNTGSNPSWDEDQGRSHLYLITSGLLNLIFQATDRAKENKWVCQTDSVVGQYNNGFNAADLASLSALRPVTGSTTFYLNTNTLTDKGTVTVSGFRPNITLFSGLDVGFKARYGRHEGFGKMWTSMVNLYEEKRGRVTDCTVLGDDPEPYILQTLNVQVIKLGNHITDEGQLMQASPKSTQTLAKEGAFVRQFFSEPTNPYMDIPSTTFAPGSPNFLPYCAYEYVNTSGNPAIAFFTYNNNDNLDIKNATNDVPWSKIRWSYVLFRDIDNVSAITRKTYRTYEIQPVQKTLLSSQIRPACLPDNMCLETLSEITCVAPDSLPSEYNDGGPDAVAKATFEAAGDEGVQVADNIVHEQAVDNLEFPKGRQATPKENLSKGGHLEKRKNENRAPRDRPAVRKTHAKGKQGGSGKPKQRSGDGKNRPKANGVRDMNKQTNKASKAVKKIKADLKKLKI